MNTKGYVSNYYKNYDEEGRLLSRHGSVEFLTTMKYLEKYIDKDTILLDIGAGTGRYSFALADRVSRVDAIELVEHNIDIFNSKIQSSDNVSISQGTAIDLSHINSNTYDVMLVFGPMYHLFTKEDKIKALSEAVRVTKVNGVILIAYCISDASILQYGFIKGHINELIEKDMINTKTFKAFSNPWDIFELHRKEDIDELNESLDVERLHYVATDGYTNHMRSTIDEMSDDVFSIYLDYHFSICEREDMVGLTHHSIDVLRKTPSEKNCLDVEPEVRNEIEYYNCLPITFDGFIDMPYLSDGEIHLVCSKKHDAIPEKKFVPAYSFLICKDSEVIGNVSLRIGYTDGLYYGGQIGYNVHEKHRGNGYAGKACKLLTPVIGAHGLSKILISNNTDNIPSRRVCEKLGGRFIRKVNVPMWHDMYKRGTLEINLYEWDIDNI